MKGGRVAIAPGTLPGLSGLDVDALALVLGERRAQPVGVAGRVDWRLSGRLARLIRQGHFEGRRHEHLLTSSGGGLGLERIFLFGAGSAFTSEVLEEAMDALSEAEARDVALAPPEGVDVLEGALAWLRAARGRRLERVVLLDEDHALVRARASIGQVARATGLTLEEPGGRG